MTRLLSATIFVLLLSTHSFSLERAIEVGIGASSPNKGFLGARFWPSQTFSAGIIMGSIPIDYLDLGISYSYHFFGHTGIYAFQSLHWLNGEIGALGITTGIGYQHLWFNNFLVYAEIGVPIYIAEGGVYRDYRGGLPRNNIYYYDANGYPHDYKDAVLFTVRTGFGIGYMFGL